MYYEKSLPGLIADVSITVFLAIFSLLMLYPLFHIIFASFSNASQLIHHRGILLSPLGFDTIAYRVVLRNPRIVTGYINTMFVLSFGLIFNISLTSLGAYFLTRRNVFWFKPIMLMILLSMYFSGGLIPFFLIVRNLGMYNSLWALIFPTAINTYNMIVLRTYFQTIPASIMESVQIDGGGHFTILFRIFIPLSLPAMAVMFLYYGVSHWNSWFNAMIFIRSRELYPIQLLLRDILLSENNVDRTVLGIDHANPHIIETVKAATIVITTLPILFIYPFLQKYFVGGLMIGSIKE